jgi:hypothetical protein
MYMALKLSENNKIADQLPHLDRVRLPFLSALLQAPFHLPSIKPLYLLSTPTTTA